ncbi:MAG: alkaline phosphatase D [Planctomycetota bacterium]|jgi:alkaline phosphatase D
MSPLWILITASIEALSAALVPVDAPPLITPTGGGSCEVESLHSERLTPEIPESTAPIAPADPGLAGKLETMDAAKTGAEASEASMIGNGLVVPPALVAGPLLGAANPTDAYFWARANVPGTYSLEVRTTQGLLVARDDCAAASDSGLNLRWHIEGLDPGREYPFRIHAANGPLPLSGTQLIRTPLRSGYPLAKIAFGSCCNEFRFPKQRIWARMRETSPETIVLLGDTPYIDSTKIEIQRSRYHTFLTHPDVSASLARLPWYGVWDDHDFGRNDTDGRLAGKANSRQAFVEFHAGPDVGRDGEGIFTSFRRGPVEVFLLDTRFFAGVESVPNNPRHKSLLGAKQWEWLENGLRTSDAEFKLLACGMIWNGAVRPGKRDHWMTYPIDRDRLFEFIGEEEVNGVVLIGGDIHRSRALRHPTSSKAGYDLTELITSPLANTVISTANAPTPALLKDMGVQETFLSIQADARQQPARLSVRFVDGDGKTMYAMELLSSELRKAKATSDLASVRASE